MILCLETSGSNCGVALWEDGLIAHSEKQNSLRHNEILLEQIEDILQENRIRFESITAVAVSAGPGSFTGLRVGMATAKGLCWSWKIPLIAIPTLESIAANAPVSVGRIAAIMPARATEVYWALFEKAGGRIEKLCDVLICEVASLSEQIIGETFLHGDGYLKHQVLLDRAFAGKLINLPENQQFVPLVVSAAELAAVRFHNNQFAEIMKAEPFYYYDFPRKNP